MSKEYLKKIEEMRDSKPKHKKFSLEDYGPYYILKKGKKYILCDADNDEPLYGFDGRGLSGSKVKKEIEFITGVSLGPLDKLFAKIMKSEAEVILAPKKKEPEELSDESFKLAKGVLAETHPLNFIVNVAHQIHAGDDELLKMEWISALSAKISKTKINTWVIGKSGKGKSHAKYTIIRLLPREYYEVFTSASPLSLFYYVKDKDDPWSLNEILLYIDEVEASKYTLPMLRSLTGQVEITPRHLSVHDAELLDLKIEGNRPVWFTSVKTFGTEQIKNRFLNSNPDETIDQDGRVFDLQDAIYRRGKKIDMKPFNVCKALTRCIVENTKDLNIDIPYRIKWVYKNRRWLYPIFLAFIKIVTKINHKNREKDKEGKLTSTEEDFEIVKKIWKTYEKQIIYRIPQRHLKILDVLKDKADLAKTHKEISEETGYSTRHIERICEDMLEEGLINVRKREKGRAKEYWKAQLPSVEDIELEKGTFDIPTSPKKQQRDSVSTPMSKCRKLKKVTFEEAKDFGICELCGYKQAGFWAFGLKEKGKTRVCYKCRGELEGTVRTFLWECKFSDQSELRPLSYDPRNLAVWIKKINGKRVVELFLDHLFEAAVHEVIHDVAPELSEYETQLATILVLKNLKRFRFMTQLCHGWCHRFPRHFNGTTVTYKTHNYCAICGRFVPRDQAIKDSVGRLACPCCRTLLRLRGRMRGNKRRRSLEDVWRFMVWDHIICPKKGGVPVTWDECLACSDLEKADVCPLHCLRVGAQPWGRDRIGYYHMSEIETPTKAFFNRKYGYARSWDDYMPLLLGTAVHKYIQSKYAKHLTEVYVKKNFGDFTVSGSIDILDDKTAILYELKTWLTAYFTLREDEPQAKPLHKWRTQGYFELLKESRPWMKIDKIRVPYIAKTRKTWDFKTRKWIFPPTWKEFPLEPNPKIMDEIKANGAALHQAFLTDTPPKPSPLELQECRAWLSRYCPHAERCPFRRGGSK